MIISVEHVTSYRYDAPVRGAVQSLRLTPSTFDGQRVQDWEIAIEGGEPGMVFTDGAGDLVQGWSVHGPVSEIVITVRGKVKTTDTSGVLRGYRERVNPRAYLRASRATGLSAGLCELAETARAEADALSQAHALSHAVNEAISYRPGVTHAHTTAVEALELGEGVCQDHAHALIAAARVLDLPGRYVSGYLQANEDGTPHEAAHAWAEIFIDGLGWVGFDASNACCPDERYIRLGSGLDAEQAAPVRGRAFGGLGEALDVTVAVEAQQQ